MGSGPEKGTQSSASGPLKPDLGPVQLSVGNSCDVGTHSWWPHANETNGQLIRHLITDRLKLLIYSGHVCLSLQGVRSDPVWIFTTELERELRLEM